MSSITGIPRTAATDIQSAVINEDNHLIITMNDGRVIDAGIATGPQGPAGGDITTAAELSTSDGGDVQSELDSHKSRLDANDLYIFEKSGIMGIYGASVAAQSTPNMTIKLYAGAYYKTDKSRVPIDAISSIAINEADATYDRIDIFYLSSDNVVTYLAGTPAEIPAIPATPSGGQILAEITVHAGATVITGTDIVQNRRTFYVTPWISLTLLNGTTGTLRRRSNAASRRMELFGTITAISDSVIVASIPFAYSMPQDMPFAVPTDNGVESVILYANGSIWVPVAGTYHFYGVGIPTY